jgi:hypothetical protein
MTDFSNPQMDAFRTQYIRDKFTAATGSAPTVALSNYNRSNKAQFVDDATVNAIKARFEIDFAEELQGVFDSKYAERVANGDDDTTATAAATDVRLQAIYRLCRSEVMQMMMNDPGFRGSVADSMERASMFRLWETQIKADRTFVRSRTTGPFASIPVEVF